MLKLDNDLLDELGLGGLPDDQKQSMLQYIYEILELRVGTNLANQMSDEQLDEFEKFIDDSGEANQAQALQWLEANLPNYKQVVNEVFEQLKVEIKQMAPQLLASSAQQVGQPPLQPGGTGAPAGYYGQGQPQAYQAPIQYAPQQQFGGPPPQTPYPSVAAPSMPQSGVPVQPAIPATYDPGFVAVPQPLQSATGQQPMQAQQPQSFAQPAQPSFGQSVPTTQLQQQDDQTYQAPNQQPPAGPGGYPPQHPNR